ncbi:MAG: LemA family protein [Erysipelotrichaceae bacterium]|nr:LemA family protein [Erysipelotrichaceae bacterium]MDD6093634.1 LemA family protein [bacterium]MDY3934742.1 LemA family protein [Bacilli bacterium]
MNTSTIVIIVIGGLLLLLVLYVIGVYNKLVNAKNKVENQFSQIDIQLKRRTDLIPNLVETVKGYAKHEKGTLTEVIEARNKAVSANTVNEKIKANSELTGAISKLFALSESYPELKANENFLSLQNDLKDTEDKITYARQFYNDSANGFNNLVMMFPSNIVANMFNFKKFDYFKIDENEKEKPEVKF